MSAYASHPVFAALRRLLLTLSAPGAALPVCYGAGLAAARLLGDGAAGQTMLAIGAPVAIGMLLRFGRGLTPVDAVALAAAHVAVATIHGEAPGVWIVTLARDLIEIGSGSLVFLRMRQAGLIRSELAMAKAAGVVALASPLAAVPLDLVIACGSSAGTFGSVAARSLADAVAMALVLGVVLTYGRDRGLVSAVDAFEDEPKPHLWEYAASGLLVAALTLGAVDGARPMSTVAASVALLWFALRLGPFATTVAAFAFASALLGFAGEGRWPALLPASDPVEAELFRYLSLALLAAPSIVVAAVVYDQKRQKRQFAYRAMHDGLTALVNRSRFVDVLGAATHSAQSRGRRFALLLIDLDHFKAVNDTYGHARGDTLLIEVANRLRRSVRATDVVARIGGDEFAVVAPVSTVADAMCLARRLVETVNQTFELQGVSVRPSVTVGGVLSPDSASDPERLMELADAALYDAKAAGRNCWMFASSERPSSRWTPAAMNGDVETVFLD